MMPARLPDFTPSEDAVAKRRRAVALAAALFVHAAAIALLLVKLPVAKNPVETAIAVEIVPVAPPKPKPPEQVLPPPPPPPLPPSPEVPEPRRESGGATDRTPGKAAETAPPVKPRPAPAPRPPKATPKQSLESLNIFPRAESSAAAVPFNPPPPPPPKTEEAMVPPQPQPSPEPAPEAPPSPDPRRGEGGGDPYLNSVRDAILRRFIYPPEAVAEHLVGTAQYQIIVDRQGNLVALHLLKSTGSGILDTAGMTTIQQAAPFGPVPDDVAGDQVGLLFIFHMGPGPASAQ